MTTLSSIQNSYIQKLPSEVPIKAAQGFLCTAALNILMGNALNIALVGGAIAVTATIIEALARPILRTIFKEHLLIGSFIGLSCSSLMALNLASLITGVNYKISSLLLSIIGYVTLNEKHFYEKNIAMAEVL